MFGSTYGTEGVTKITIRTNGDLHLEGTDGTQVNVLSDADELVRGLIEGDQLNVSFRGDGYVQVPANLVVFIQRVGGDAHIRGLKSTLTLQRINGDASIEDVTDLQIDTIGGDCLLYHTGTVKSGRVGGDLNGKDLGGIQGSAGGDISLFVSGEVVLNAGGDITLGSGVLDDTTLNAGGDITVCLPQGSGASLDLTSGGRQIGINAGGKQMDIDEANYKEQIGNGGPLVRVHAGGDILIADQPWDNQDVIEKIAEMDEDWENFADEIENLKAQAERHQQRAERIAQRATRMAERISAQAERHVEDVVRRIEEQTKNWGNFPIPPMPPTPAGGINDVKVNRAATAEERELILQMLAEKKITAEQADKLLQALEG
jgi:hypothetical protein